MNRALSLSHGAVALSSGCFLGWFQVTVPVLFCGANFLSQRAEMWVPRLGPCSLGKHVSVSVLVWDGPLPDRHVSSTCFCYLERPGEQQRARRLEERGLCVVMNEGNDMKRVTWFCESCVKKRRVRGCSVATLLLLLLLLLLLPNNAPH